MFQYLHLVCQTGNFQENLNHYGQEGWRLHTWEPMVATDESGQAVLNLLVVMERVSAPEAQRHSLDDYAAMAMRG